MMLPSERAPAPLLVIPPGAWSGLRVNQLGATPSGQPDGEAKAELKDIRTGVCTFSFALVCCKILPRDLLGMGLSKTDRSMNTLTE